MCVRTEITVGYPGPHGKAEVTTLGRDLSEDQLDPQSKVEVTTLGKNLSKDDLDPCSMTEVTTLRMNLTEDYLDPHSKAEVILIRSSAFVNMSGEHLHRWLPPSLLILR